VGAHHEDPDRPGVTLDPVVSCTQEGTFEDGEARFKCDHGVTVEEKKNGGWW
jgi:hypothetical protein